MPTIKLTQGQRARVDWQDYRELMQFKWCAAWSPEIRSFYAVRNTHIVSGKKRMTRMHRQILGLEHSDRRKVDHKNHDTLDNRRRNLRVVTTRQNGENRLDQSKHGVGVHEDKRRRSKPFQVQVQADGKWRHVGMYPTPEEAQAARRKFLEEQSAG